jgi:hypothetical protein
MHDDGTIMEVDEPANDEAEGGASLADVSGEARDTGFDGSIDTPETSPRSHTSRSAHSDRPAPLLGKETISEDIHMSLDRFKQRQAASKRQEFERSPSGQKYALTGPFPQEPPMISHFRPSTKEPFPVECWTSRFH